MEPRPSLSLVAQFKGYVTTYAAIAGKGRDLLEQTLGFNAGALKTGYRVFELTSPIVVGDFIWKDQTIYSDGWHFDPSIDEYVQRYDELRAHFGRLNNWNEAAVDAQLQRFMEDQRHRLNVRGGPERIVKVVPIGRVTSFPDAPMRGHAQWKLITLKTFRHVEDVGPG